ncbi:MAG: hypothetical protein R3B96_09040 [Pirellulaceae bacterium]
MPSQKPSVTSRLAFIQPGHASVVAEWMIGERESVGVVVLALAPVIAACPRATPFERQRVLLGKLAELRRVEPEVIAELQRILRLVVDDCPPQGESIPDTRRSKRSRSKSKRLIELVSFSNQITCNKNVLKRTFGSSHPLGCRSHDRRHRR